MTHPWGFVPSTEYTSLGCGCFCLARTEREAPLWPIKLGRVVDVDTGAGSWLPSSASWPHGLHLPLHGVCQRDSPCWNQGARAGPEDINMIEALNHRAPALGTNCLIWSSTQPSEVAVLLSPLYRWESWGSETCHHLSKVTQTGKNRARFNLGHALTTPSRCPLGAGTSHFTKHSCSSLALNHGAALWGGSITFSMGLLPSLRICFLLCKMSKLIPNSGVECYRISAALLLSFLSLFPFYRWSSEKSHGEKAKEPTRNKFYCFFFLISNWKHIHCRKMLKYWQRKVSDLNLTTLWGSPARIFHTYIAISLLMKTRSY